MNKESKSESLMRRHYKLYVVLKHIMDVCRLTKNEIAGLCREYLPFVRNDNYKRLLEYKNKYRGKRCFVVANGPSVTPEDLDLIKDEYSIGMNYIYTVFDKTEWRPTWWTVTDSKKVLNNTIKNKPYSIPIFTTRECLETESQKFISDNNIVYVQQIYLRYHHAREKMMRWWSEAGTVAVFALELAMYMGFSEIILLGYDNTLSIKSTHHVADNNEVYRQEGEAKQSRISKRAARLGKSQMSENEFDQSVYNEIMDQYKGIKKLAKKKKINIINSTRGGRLEVFERKNLEEVI